MVRAPCCEKMGLKKGPWTPEEDQLLINYIQQHGHGNWRALPKLAGLFRCGKSCRLRWTNYLRPDVKRGNFTREEENTIIQLHEVLGNRWSAIAARLPGRTDNEIKNVWHTHLKKRLNNTTNPSQVAKKRSINLSSGFNIPELKTEPEFFSSGNVSGPEAIEFRPISPQQCCSDVSSATAATGHDHSNSVGTSVKAESSEYLAEMDETFWSEVLSSDSSSSGNGYWGTAVNNELQYQIIPFSHSSGNNCIEPVQNSWSASMHENMDFWYNLFTRAGESLELPEI